MENELLIIGVDLSLVNTGVCVMHYKKEFIENYLITTELKGIERLSYVRQQFKNILSIYERYEKVVFIEGYSFNSQGRHESIAELGGIIRIFLYDEGISYFEVPPKSLKKYIVNNGNADKISVAIALMKHFEVELNTEHERDAYALAEVGKAYMGLTYNLKNYQEEVIKVLKNPKLQKGRGRPKKTRRDIKP